MNKNTTCSVSECDRPGFCRGFCTLHYQRWAKYGSPLITANHGHTRNRQKSPEYQAWNDMNQRCANPRHACYADYGGRGITVCAAWRHSFPAFLADMGERPSPRHTLERKNNDAGYSPENCVWATKKEQSRNTRSNVLITIGSQTLGLSDWADLRGIPHWVIRGRRTRGWSDERAVMTPVKPYKPRQPKESNNERATAS